MCGIYISVSNHKHCTCKINNVPDQLKRFLINRGPDNYSTTIIEEKSVKILAVGAVLHQRGPKNCITQQPLVDASSNVLLWNGEIFGGLDISPETNDTRVMLELLASSDNESDILNAIGGLHGPFAFVYWSDKLKQLWFGRDILGRRSLVWKLSQGNCTVLQISSVTDGLKGWEEVPTQGILCLNLLDGTDNFTVNCYNWTSTPSGSKFPQNENELSLLSIIKNSMNINIPISEVFNHALVNPKLHESTLDYIANIYGLEKSTTLNNVTSNLKNITKNDSLTLLQLLIDSKVFDVYLDNFYRVLKEAVDVRVNSQPLLCKNCSINSVIQNCEHASLGILFSGGVDCIVLAILADKCLKSDLPIDLMNVSFEHSKGANSNSIKRSIGKSPQVSFESPDRVTGTEGYKELVRICPNRKWNFVEINVTTEQLKEARESQIKYLIHPSETVLDDSIGCAIWFAAKGEGMLYDPDGNGCIEYASPSRVLLLGMGADEQLGGYSRHRQKYLMGGWESLRNEMILEIDRISLRNLGRDDRIISDHGREARFPYLDENVVSFLNGVPIHMKLNLELPRGVGEKLLLRMLAFKLNLRNASVLPKRAIQFGSRIAKSEGKEKGADLCKRL